MDSLRANPVLPSLPILGPISLGLVLGAQPRDKLTLGGAVDIGPWRITMDAARYGTLVTPDTGQVFDAETLVNASIAFDATEHVRLLAGVQNLTDAYPDDVIPNPDGRRYSELTPIGVDGRQYYVRVTASF